MPEAAIGSRAEERPDAQAALATQALRERQAHSQDDHDAGRGVLADLEVHALAHLLDDESHEAEPCVQRCTRRTARPSLAEHGGAERRGQAEPGLHQHPAALDERLDAGVAEGAVELFPLCDRAEARGDRDDRSECQEPFAHCAEVADEP